MRMASTKGDLARQAMATKLLCCVMNAPRTNDGLAQKAVVTLTELEGRVP